jgi:hypothetical protein
MGDVSEDARMLCKLLGIEWVSPEDGSPELAPVGQRAPTTRKAPRRKRP